MMTPFSPLPLLIILFVTLQVLLTLTSPSQSSPYLFVRVKVKLPFIPKPQLLRHHKGETFCVYISRYLRLNFKLHNKCA